MSSAPPTKSSYHHGDLHRALVTAALKQIESGSGPQLNLRATAERAGVSNAAPYRHFKSREALLAAALAEGFRDLTAREEAARAACTDPVDALKACGMAYIDFAARRPHLYRLMYSPEIRYAGHPGLVEAGAKAMAVLYGAVSECRASIGFEEADIGWLSRQAHSMVHGVASLYVNGFFGPKMTREALDDQAYRFLTTLIDGTRARIEDARRPNAKTQRPARKDTHA